ncbi:MAG TPA: hypothetical protein EYH34_09855 [Planctomycetes bacterium]|nr:hypothetical protein [Planctomycetota bacterium]
MPMAAEPPAELVDLLEQLGLSGRSELRRVAGTARRLARGLPLFESVWVDALQWSRLLTPYQAQQINAGRAEYLRVGHYLIRSPLPSAGYCRWFEAQRVGCGKLVRLAVRRVGGTRAEQLARSLEQLRQKCSDLPSVHLAPVVDTGQTDGTVWAAVPRADGLTASEWLSRHGRFPPPAVLEIARQMLEALAEIERIGLCHGDISPLALMVNRSGQAVLLHPGLRPVLRPEEGFGHDDLPPEGYDGVAPEQVRDGAPASTATDLYACGTLWWRLLTGRSAAAGGDALGKLCALQRAEVPDVRQFAPGTPEVLAEMIARCGRREPGERPQSIAWLAQRLGPPTPEGRKQLASAVRHPSGGPARWVHPAKPALGGRDARMWVAVVAACVVTAVAAFWAIWREDLAARRPRHGPTAKAVGPFDPAKKRAASDAVAPRAPDADSTTASPSDMAAGDVAQRPPLAASARPEPSAPSADSASGPVVPAAYVAGQREMVVEVADREAFLSAFRALRAGQTIRGAGDRPLVVAVPPGGLAVRDEDVWFENICFVPPHRAEAISSGTSWLVGLRVSQVGFRRCFFRGLAGAPEKIDAIRWSYPADRAVYREGLPSGQIQLQDCVFDQLGAAVACHTAGAVAVRFDNALALRCQRVLALDHAPRWDEPVVLSLRRLTVRGGGPLVECRYQNLDEKPGRVTIRAAGCVFFLERDLPLLRFVGPQPPDPLVAAIRWTGSGSVLAAQGLVAAWIRPGSGAQKLDDSSLAIAGLIRSELTFAGPLSNEPRDSRTTGWQGPLLSPDAPGIDPARLASPAP